MRSRDDQQDLRTRNKPNMQTQVLFLDLGASHHSIKTSDVLRMDYQYHGQYASLRHRGRCYGFTVLTIMDHRNIFRSGVATNTQNLNIIISWGTIWSVTSVLIPAPPPVWNAQADTTPIKK